MEVARKMKLVITVMCSVLLFAASAAASKGMPVTLPENSPVAPILDEAKRLEAEARDIARQLRAKKADVSRAAERMEVLENHLRELESHIAAFEAAKPPLNTAQEAQFERIKAISASLQAVTTAKKATIESSDSRKRDLLRAHAIGIARRAEMLQQAALRMGA